MVLGGYVALVCLFCFAFGFCCGWVLLWICGWLVFADLRLVLFSVTCSGFVVGCCFVAVFVMVAYLVCGLRSLLFTLLIVLLFYFLVWF